MRLREKLINFVYKAATSERRERNILTAASGLAFISAIIILLVLVSSKVDKLFGFTKLFSAQLSMIVSAPLLATGLFFMLWSVALFLKAKGTPVPLRPPKKLVITGPYAYVRNPMISGYFLVLFGLGTLLRSPSLVFIFAPLFVTLITLWTKAIEEPELEKRLGEEYLDYKNKVPMFIPRLLRPRL